MNKSLKWKAGLIGVVIGLSIYFIIANSINPGIDLAGGTHFVIEVLVDDVPKEERKDVMDQTLALYRKRIDKIGLAGTNPRH